MFVSDRDAYSFVRNVLSCSEREQLVRWITSISVAQTDASAREEEPAPSIIARRGDNECVCGV